ncbi:MAG: oligoendopeptidase F [Anaerolineae bacterium]|nr:oligoendopeptidase F [Anaerolineae bacterium]
MTHAKTALPARSDIPKQYTWNAESVFETRAAWAAAAQSIAADLPKAAAYKGRLAEGAAVLADFMAEADHLTRLLGKVYVYASMSSAVDTTDVESVSMLGQAGGLYGQVLATLSFSDPELLAIGRETLEAWVASEPRLAHYGQYVDNLFRQQAHVRSGEVEEVIGLASDMLDSIYMSYSQLVNADLKFAPATGTDGQTYEVAQGSINTLLDSPDRTARRTAWNNYMDGYLAYRNTIAANYALSLKQDVFLARVRGYGSSVEASLFSNNIPKAVFTNLIDTFKKHIPTWHKYWAVKRRVMGYDSLHTYDVWAPMVKDEPRVPYEQAVDWIGAGMRPLGDDYVNALRRGCLEDRWVDVYPNQGKRQGAFSSGVHDTFPFIMMSYDDNLGAMSTLAHELGHSMHSYLARKTQPAAYSGYTLFVAEVASNFNQAMTRAHLMREYADDKTFQIALIQEAMTNFHRYFFIMPTLARFELEMHERVEQGRGVTAQDMNALMADLYAEGYGSEMTLDRERDGITWATFGHLYSAFYVYQYATGISAAHALSERILAGDGEAAKRYVEFLSMGSAKYPLDALKHAGVDMTTPEAVETTFGVLARYVDRLDELTR